MTAKEKAIELIRKFYSIGAIQCKQCALIAVDEILLGYMGNPKVKYWQEVKQEIEKL